jgi:glutamyl-tRNA reductase
MNVLCLGISHHTASVQLREQINLSGANLNAALASFAMQAADFHPLTEVAILSTCSRFELYAVTAGSPPETAAEPQIFEPLLRYALGLFSIPQAELEPHLYRWSGEDAVHHLCRVAASLDSIVLGEPQVLGQVSEAHQAALENGSTRHVLSSLFRAAIHTGKRVRTETAIGQRPTNMSAVAIRLAETVFDNLTKRQVLVIGTGEIGQQSIKALRDHGISSLAVASRSQQRAAQAGLEWGARPLTLDLLEEGLLHADVVVASSNQSHPIIDRAMAIRVAAKRSNRPLVLVDLAVPRNIDPAIRAVNGNRIHGVHLFDMDDIQSYINSSMLVRRNEIPRAEAIVAEETTSFSRWLAVIPMVGELHRRAELIRQQEFERALHFLPDADPHVIEQIERMSHSLVRKILHQPTARLRHEADNTNLENYIEALTYLFDLPESGQCQHQKGEAS